MPGSKSQTDAGEGDRKSTDKVPDSRAQDPLAEEARINFVGEAWALLKPEVQAVTARAAYLAATNQLIVDNMTVQKALLSANTPVAQQLLERWQLMEQQGWVIQQRASTSAYFGASYVRDKKLVNYDPPTSLFDHVLGAPTRKEEAISQVVHELSHHDGHTWYPIGAADASANIGMAKRILATEARCLLTEGHIMQALNAGDSRLGHLGGTLNALRNNDLGGYIHRTWPDWSINMEAADRVYQNPVNPEYRYQSMPYPEFRFISEAEARLHVNQYLTETFGPDYFDPKTGKIKAIDINAGLGKMNFPLHEGEIGKPPFDANYRWQVKPEDSVKIKAPTLDPFDRGLGRTNRALHAAGAFGAVTMVGDIGSQFNESPGSGVGRLGKIGVSWVAFEVAMRLSNVVIGRRARPFAGLIGAIGAGGVSAHLADRHIGEQLEEALRRQIDDNFPR